MAEVRQYHTASLLPNGKVLVTGGFSFYILYSSELYDPATRTWSGTDRMIVAREHHTATSLANGEVLVAGL